MIARVACLLAVLAAAPVRADDTAPIEVSGGLAPTVDVHQGSTRARLFGALAPAVDVGYWPGAAERDRWAYGAGGSRATLGIDAELGDVTGMVFVLVGSPAPGQSALDVDRAVVRYKPIRAFAVSAGLERAPFDIGSATPTAAMLFPSRVPVANVIGSTPQAGIKLEATHDLGAVIVGVWNGAESEASATMPVDERGIMTSARVELTPLGRFPFDENGGDGALHVGIGAGATYRAATAYAADGQAGTRSRDLRASASVRVGYRGLLVEAEVLRKQVTEDLEMRPDVATVAYVQGSWRIHAGHAQLFPLLRLGTLALRELSAPASGHSVELGLAAFPLPTERLRVVAIYQSIVDPTLGSNHRGIVQARFAF